MSLLLDALKKAAADKEKSGNKDDENRPEELEAKAISDDDLPAIDEDVYQAPEIDEELIAESTQNRPIEEPAAEVTEDMDLELDDDFDLSDNSNADSAKESITTDDETAARIETDIDVSKTVESESVISAEEEKIEIVQAEKVAEQSAQVEAAYAPLPDYNHNDARKILEISQKRFRNKQRIMYYGMYVFAALLFFVASYLYYTTETLDNSQQPRFKPSLNSAKVTSQISSAKTVAKQTIAVDKTTTPIANNKQAVASKKTTAVKTNTVKQPTKITIVKQKRPDPISVLLQKAYSSYQSGQYQQADDLYQQVLRRDARQRDALLGKAAVAVVNRHYTQAKNYYQQVLHLYPKDSIAKSALVDLLKKHLSVANESQLNVLLRENPQAAHVHFSLGLLYARQDRLKESQHAFFDAYSIEKKPDYAYNLAVMLDKLNKPKAALVYYKKASELADSSSIHFNEKIVLERIEQLEAKHE